MRDRLHPGTPPDTSAPPPLPCAACGIVAPAALVAYPDDPAPPLALCAACAHDRAALRTVLRALGCPERIVVTGGGR